MKHAMGYRYSKQFTPRRHKDESNEQDSNHVRFDWDRDFCDIESDDIIEGCDLESLAIATQHRSANIGGGKDAFTGNISEHRPSDQLLENPYQFKSTVTGDTIPELRIVPDSCIKWVEPEHLEAAKQEHIKQGNHEQDH
ncbi:hypothetical protein FNAPI_12853 [Fusarium napiforme]|uniref:Uncharacterized protein n=1 Tax=Fusarium napiforme TaxID=42672 RepID=A0A8H5MKW1_9HYPO|nr:hypothetical protein FNAPI_12853 [Fusarium napiforme]